MTQFRVLSVVFKNKRFLSGFICFSLVALSSLTSTQVHALGDQWYIGIGGVGSLLDPNPRQPGLNVTDDLGIGGSILFGRDLDSKTSVQVQVLALGEAQFANGVPVTYGAADAAVLYRVFDSRTGSLNTDGFGISLYGIAALGFMYRDTTQSLSDDAPVHFALGAGLETYLWKGLSIRTEAAYHEADAASASMALVYRFGGASVNLARLPDDRGSSQSNQTIQSVPATPTDSEPLLQPDTSAETSVARNADVDGDGVADGTDSCLSSARGFPVRENGCPLFDGVLSGVLFDEGTANLSPGSNTQLDSLINVLLQYPNAKIELHAHSDNSGDIKSQSVLTRSRLRTVGTYLLKRGIRSNRMALRSFGGAKPRFNNDSATDRQRNNRIEVFEKRE